VLDEQAVDHVHVFHPGVRVKGSDGNVITPGSDASENEPDEDQPVPCAFCPLLFPDAEEALTHMKEVHPDGML